MKSHRSSPSAAARTLQAGVGWIRRLLILTALLTGLLQSKDSASAQSQSPNYWQYPASERLRFSKTIDLDFDGVDEFLIADENGKLDLLNSNGTLRWSFAVGEPVLSMNTLVVTQSPQPEMGIIIGTRNYLTLLSNEGQKLWDTAIMAFPIPPSRFAGPSRESEDSWMTQFEALPIDLAALDSDMDGNDEIAVLLDSGQVRLYDREGSLIWRYVPTDIVSRDGRPSMAVGDLNGDGIQEIALGLFDQRLRFSQLMVIDSSGAAMWEQAQSISGRIAVLTLVSFADSPNTYIAVANNLGQISLFQSDRQRLWQRTLNKPITSVLAADLSDETGLVVGTRVGTVTAFSEEGRRVWTRYLSAEANQAVLALSATPSHPTENQPALSVILESSKGPDEPSDAILLSGGGRILYSFPAVDTIGLSQLTDINRDGSSELLLVRFAQVELIGLGLGASETALGWDYNLFSRPRSVLVIDLDQDGTDELIIGTQDGRIHSIDSEKSIRWLHSPGGAITHLAVFNSSTPAPPEIVAIRNSSTTGLEGSVSYESWIDLRQANGKQSWEQRLTTPITVLAVGDLNGHTRNEIVVGTSDGDVLVYSASGTPLWQSRINGAVRHLLILEDSESGAPVLVAATRNQVYVLARNESPYRIAASTHDIYSIIGSGQSSSTGHDSMIILSADGSIQKRTASRGYRLPQWRLELGASPTANLPASEAVEEAFEQRSEESLIVATDRAQLLHLNLENNQPVISWTLNGLPRAKSLYWSDLDGDTLSEIAVGTEDGRVEMYKIRPNLDPQLMTDLDLSSGVFALTALQRQSEPRSDLVAIADNGLVQLFRTQENWPPLLTDPQVDVTENQYSIVITVSDIENDEVTVELEIYNSETGVWESQSVKRLSNGSGTLFWLVDHPLSSTDGVSYRFRYSDGFHTGTVTPPLGPIPPLVQTTVDLSPQAMGLISLAAAILMVIVLRQSQLPAAQARRFYRRIRQQPPLSLSLLEIKYTTISQSPDFLLYLANQARKHDDGLIAGLADGLFLLTGQPHAGLPIILEALANAAENNPPWLSLDRWQLTHKVGQLLLEAPSVTELTLLRPQLVQLLSELDESDNWSPVLDALLPVMTNLRDSERVDTIDDRLVYLNEAAFLLAQLETNLTEFSAKIDKTLVAAISERWSALVSAEIEDLRGRAELEITLKTRRLVPSEETSVVLEIRNSGRASAENLFAQLDEDPAYINKSEPQIVRLLPPGRTRQISFTISPQVSDRFRISLTATYNDRNPQEKTVAFGDMVHLLPPARDFHTIPNPYLPGTPLRRNSPVFYGRQELFTFIAENAGDLTQRNVLILVGERRTGKTSVLLRLDEHLPEHLLSVYIDCQSLGVVAGMPAFLHDLSWYIADALALRGIEIDVPEPTAWQKNPTGLFQRHFLPKVHSLLPPGTNLLLVFDEFEAFENMVDDKILPPTLFPYLRHLMQHSQGLSFVFVGTRRLEEMSADYWSVLFNIALYRKIGYLSDESATQLICDPVKPNLTYDDLALDKILRVTTGHPYFIQLVCYTLVKRANAQRSTYATISDVNAALDEMLRLGEVHFAYLWQRSTSLERTLLTAMAHLMDRDQPFRPSDIIQYLQPYSIHLNPTEVTEALTHLVERDILREMTHEATLLYELKIGLVGLWIARYKSLSTLLTENGDARAAAVSSKGQHQP